jgi:hypothetical protein
MVRTELQDPLQPTELTADPRFTERVVRLTITSACALALIWFLSTVTLQPHPMIGLGLALGWVLMPSVLGLSLRWPRLRYALIVPATLVTVALLAICATALPQNRVIASGWLLITGGVLLGALLGAWFWFRWMPVPGRFSDPFSRGRWALIVVHIGLIALGVGLIGFSAA